MFIPGCSGTDLDKRAVVVNAVTAMRRHRFSHKQLVISHSKNLGRRISVFFTCTPLPKRLVGLLTIDLSRS